MLLYTILAQTASADPLAATRLILALVCVIVASSLALGVCIGLMRRINTIAPPDAVPPSDSLDNNERTEQA